jgi:thiamine-monophosphate kinase
VARLFGAPPEGELWSGDDAAVVSTPGESMLLTIDTLVDGVDFDLSYCEPQDVGWKAIAANISDIAAMGGSAGYAVTAMWLPSSTPLEVAEGIASGMAECCKTYSVAMVGGDISDASELGLAVAMTGGTEGDPVTRGGALPGHLLGVTGRLGGAAAGLAALQSGKGAEFPDVARRQLRPEPRAREGPALARAGVSAMIDISDGLASDLGHLCDASNTGCEVDIYALPIDRGVEAVARALGIAVLDLGVAGGEDFELLFAVPEDRLNSVRESMNEMGTPITVIGRLTSEGAQIAGRSLEEWKRKGWEHLRSR